MANDPRADMLRGERGEHPRGYRIEGGAVLVPIVGALVPRGPVGMAAWGVTSYEGLRDELRRAVADAGVTSIVLIIANPSGYVTGVDAAADAILRARKVKSAIAVVEGMAASAAYWLASQCDAIVASPLSSLGSIGALQVHVDVSRGGDQGDGVAGWRQESRGQPLRAA